MPLTRRHTSVARPAVRDVSASCPIGRSFQHISASLRLIAGSHVCHTSFNSNQTGTRGCHRHQQAGSEICRLLRMPTSIIYHPNACSTSSGQCSGTCAQRTGTACSTFGWKSCGTRPGCAPLPTDVCCVCCSLLPGKAVGAAACASRSWRQQLRDEVLWKELCRQEWGLDVALWPNGGIHNSFRQV